MSKMHAIFGGDLDVAQKAGLPGLERDGGPENQQSGNSCFHFVDL